MPRSMHEVHPCAPPRRFSRGDHERRYAVGGFRAQRRTTVRDLCLPRQNGRAGPGLVHRYGKMSGGAVQSTVRRGGARRGSRRALSADRELRPGAAKSIARFPWKIGTPRRDVSGLILSVNLTEPRDDERRGAPSLIDRVRDPAGRRVRGLRTHPFRGQESSGAPNPSEGGHPPWRQAVNCSRRSPANDRMNVSYASANQLHAGSSGLSDRE